MNALRVSWLFFKLGVLNELQYRVNFVVSLFQAAIALVTGLVVLALVYSHTEELNGWTQPELLCVLGIQILMGGLIRTSIQPNMTRLIEDVHDGKLDYALTKPEDAQMLVSVREVRIWQVVDVISGLDRARCGALEDLDRRQRRRRGRVRRLARPRSRAHLLLLAGHRDRGVLGREHVDRRRAVRRRLPDRTLADRDLPAVASRRRDVPRADRLRRHGAGGGAHVPIGLADTRSSPSCSQ